jgi:hypothetical protein
MHNDPSVEAAVQEYLDAVKKAMGTAPLQRKETLLHELREYIHEDIIAGTPGRAATLQDAYATLSKMDLPETYAEALPPEHSEQTPIRKLLILVLICNGLQIAGLGASIAGIPVIGAIGGFSAIVSFLLIWSSRQSPKWLLRLTGVAAICGLGTIIIEISRVL